MIQQRRRKVLHHPPPQKKPKQEVCGPRALVRKNKDQASRKQAKNKQNKSEKRKTKKPIQIGANPLIHSNMMIRCVV
jgi:hypothetical protein